LLPAKARRLYYLLDELYVMCLFEFIRVEGVATFVKHFRGWGASYRSLETPAVVIVGSHFLTGSKFGWAVKPVLL
jgi:hypothetical protein